MFEFMQSKDGPVVEGLEEFEVVMARDQLEYRPLRCVAGNTRYGPRLSRWTLTDEQRQAVARGADIFLELSAFNRPMNPIRMMVSNEPASAVEYFRKEYDLVPALSAPREKTDEELQEEKERG